MRSRNSLCLEACTIALFLNACTHILVFSWFAILTALSSSQHASLEHLSAFGSRNLSQVRLDNLTFSVWQLQVVSRDIRRILTQRADHFNIVLDDVSITQLTFGREYTHAIESKQVAQQEAERAKFIVSPRPWSPPCSLIPCFQLLQYSLQFRACLISYWTHRTCPCSDQAHYTSPPHFIDTWSILCIWVQVEKAEQDKQSAVIRAQGEVYSFPLQLLAVIEHCEDKVCKYVQECFSYRRCLCHIFISGTNLSPHERRPKLAICCRRKVLSLLERQFRTIQHS